MTAKHTPLPWFIYASEEYIAGKTPLNFVSIWAGEGRREHIVANDIAKSDAQFIVLACNWHDEAKEALTEIALLCESDNAGYEKIDWQDILRRANSALEHLARAENKSQVA